MTQRRLLPFLLVGLPVGLAGSVAVAVYLYYHPLELRLPGRAARPTAVDLIRKSPTEKDLRDYRRILTAELPDRSSGSPAALNATANWLASTLGPTNIGLPVKIQNLGATPEAGRNILVELPGLKAPAEVIVVCTAYDAEDPGLNSATSTAMIMTVATAFVGLPQQRTLVFAFLCHDQPSAGEKSGIETLVAGIRASGRAVLGAIDVRVQGVPEAPSHHAGILGYSETPSEPWTTEAWQALITRQPRMDWMQRRGRADLARQASEEPPVSRLPWWQQAGPPVPFLLLVLQPAAPDDADSPLDLARSLEGTVQTLANHP